MTIEYVVALWLTFLSPQCQAGVCKGIPAHQGMKYHIVDQNLEACVVNDGNDAALAAVRVEGKRIQVLMGEGIRPCVGPAS